MQNKKEFIVYSIVTILLVAVCGVIAFLNVNSTSKPPSKVNSGPQETPNGVKLFAKNKFSKIKLKTIFVPEGLDIEAIDQELKKKISNEERTELIAELYGTRHPKILDIVNRELDNENEEIRLDALDLLSEYENEEIFDNLSKALDDKSENVRKAAIDLLEYVDIEGGSYDEALLLSRGVEDKSEDIREATLSILMDKPRSEIEVVAEKAISSKYTEVKEEILGDLALNPSLNGVEIMMRGLLDKNQEFREEVISELELITDKTFSSYKQALSWWGENGHKFEEEFEEDD